jgi:hypothetical protein
MRRATLIAVIALVGLGCEVDAPEESNFGEQDLAADAGDTSALDLGGGDARIVTSLDGTWLVWSQLSTCVSLGTFIQEGVSRTLFLVEADQDEDSGYVDETWQACLMVLPVVLDVPTFATEALYQVSYPVGSTEGFVSSTQPGGGYVSGRLAELWGFDTEDRLRDAFPVEGTDPRISDTDGDGNPGVTLLVSDQCENYMIQRALTTFEGHFTAPDLIEGRSVSFTETMTVAASTSFCATPYVSRSNDSRNVFVRYRIDGQGGSRNLDANEDGTITCDEVVGTVDTLFTRIVADDDNCSF